MKRVPAGWVCLFFASALVASAQTTAARIRFTFENPKLQPANYVLDVNEDGTGSFHSEPGSAAASDPEGITPQAITTDIKIADPLRSELFRTARSHSYFAVACENAKSKVAFTGKKVLQYSGPDGNGSCTFNWSHDQQIMKIADDFIAVAYTLEIGRRLALEHEHNRLGLDPELQELQDAVKDGRAQQIQNIAPQLESIASDEKVLERVRLRARQLLSDKTS